jgi:putative peptidoglycan lipid II flippase
LIIFWQGKTWFGIPNNFYEYWFIILIFLAAALLLAMLHGALSTHFVNKGNVLFQVSQNLWINLGMVGLILFGSFFNGAVLLAIGVAVGSAFLLIVEIIFLRNFNLFKKKSYLRLGKYEIDKTLWATVIFIMLQAISSKGQILVERTLGVNLPEGSISALNYAQRFLAMPFNFFLPAIVFPMVPRLAENYRRKEYYKLWPIAKKACLFSAVLIIPPLILINIYGESIIALLLQRGRFTAHDSHLVSQLLLIYSFAAMGMILVTVSLRVLWILGKAQLSFIFSSFSLIIYFAIAYALCIYGAKGLAASYAIYFNISGLSLFFIMKYFLNRHSFLTTI